ncbi:hypothetical protein HMSSN036_24940 [Paenibacillus macerans]|nr:hypothetical protein HMSSN036_24940 [Paenibacillus macerans]
MIIYSSNALKFRESVDRNQITVEIERAFLNKMGMKPSRAKKEPGTTPCSSWNESSVIPTLPTIVVS